MGHLYTRYASQPGVLAAADGFDPERWIDEDLHHEGYMPFGSGPRLCIGEHFALMEMQLILSAIIKNWDFKLEVDIVEEKPLVTLRPASAVMISIQRRGK